MKYCLSAAVMLLFYMQSIAQVSATYAVDAILTGSQVKGEVVMSVSNDSKTTIDTIYLHLHANAMTDRGSSYMQDLVTRGRVSSYFDNDNLSAGYSHIGVKQGQSDLSIVGRSSMMEQVYVVLDEPLHGGQTIELEIQYQLDLPVYSKFMGIGAKDIALQYWYPLLASRDRSGWQYEPLSLIYQAPHLTAKHSVSMLLPSEYVVAAMGVEQDIMITGEQRKVTLRQLGATSAMILVKNGKRMSELVTYGDQGIQVNVVSDRKEVRMINDVAALIGYYNERLGPLDIEEAWVVVSDTPIDGIGLVSLPADSDYQEDILAGSVSSWWLNDRIPSAWMTEGIELHLGFRYAYGDEMTKDIYCNCDRTVSARTALTNYYKTGYMLPLSAEVDDYGKADYCINQTFQSLQAVTHLASYLGDDFDRVIRSIRSTKRPISTLGDLRRDMEQVTGKNLTWFFNGVADGGKVDYRIAGFREQIVVQNVGDIAAPIPWQATYWDGIVQSGWLPALRRDTTIVLPETPKKFVLDPAGITMDLDYDNNYLERPTQLRMTDGTPSEAVKAVELAPLVTYNYTDRVTLGVTLHNDQSVPSRWYYHLSPQFGLGSQSIVGSAAARFVSPVASGGVDRIEYQLTLRSFNYDNFTSEQEGIDIDNSFFRLSPSMRVYFDDLDHTTFTELEYIFLNEDQFFDSSAGVRQDNLNSSFLRWGIYSEDKGYINTTDYALHAEGGRYTSLFRVEENYLRLSGEITKKLFYNPKHKVQLRLWGSGFLANSRGSESASTQSYKGVIALSHQPFNDYTYDDYYIDRLSSASFLSRQVNTSMQGGFRHATGIANSSQIGQSQRYAAAMNIDVDLPIKSIYPLVVQWTTDVGAYNQRTSFSNSELRYLYSTGISFSMPGVVLHVPLLYSEEFMQAYRDTNRGFFDRITFSLDLNSFDFWTNSYERYK